MTDTKWIEALNPGDMVATLSTGWHDPKYEKWEVSRVSEKSIWIHAHGMERRFRKRDGKGISIRWSLLELTDEIQLRIDRAEAIEKIESFTKSHRLGELSDSTLAVVAQDIDRVGESYE